MTLVISKRCIRVLMSTRTLPWTKIFSHNELDKKYPMKLLVLYMCNSCADDRKKKNTIGYAIKHWQERFLQEGIAEPFESIEHLVSHVMGSKKIVDVNNHHEKVLDKEQLEKLELLCKCRLSRMPLQYIIGECTFRELTLMMEPPIFIPWPETEVFVDYVIKRISSSPNKENSILEIGCGTGAICLSILHSIKNTNIVAIDVNPRACELTIRNAEKLNLDMRRLTVFNAAMQNDGKIEMKKSYKMGEKVDFSTKKFDFVVSNPPYVPTNSALKLVPEIKVYQDRRAFNGGDDGMKWMGPIIKYASEALNVGGYLLLEVDPITPKSIRSLIEKYYANQLRFEYVHKDLCNEERVVEILKINSNS